jgi:SAM-dependent methyltransferase
MQEKVFNYVKQQVARRGLADARVLDIGSYDVNGSLRPLFTNYTGLDMRPGPNVDQVANSHQMPFPDCEFEVVTCVEMLEHDDNPFKTMQEIHRVLKPGGWVILAASGIFFPPHEYPADYWRFTAAGLGVLLRRFEQVETHADRNEAYGTARKPEAGES